MEAGECQLFHVVIIVNPDATSAFSSSLSSGGITRAFQVHGSLRVLHGAVIDHDQLLHIFRNGAARIGAELRTESRQGCQRRGHTAECQHPAPAPVAF